MIFGVLGWVDLTAPAVAHRIAELRAGAGGDKLVCGIRGASRTALAEPRRRGAVG